MASTGRVASFGRDPSSDGRVTGGRVTSNSVHYRYERRDEDASRWLYGSGARLAREALRALARRGIVATRRCILVSACFLARASYFLSILHIFRPASSRR